MVHPSVVEKISLKDQVAFVTGGGGGIGQGIAVILARAGAHVVVGDIVPERGRDTVDQIEAEGGQASAVTLDVMQGDQIVRAIEDLDAKFGRLDILVNNAGGTSSRLLLQQKERNWRKLIDMNLMSVVTATAAAAPIMIRNGRGGSIISVTSSEGSRAAPTFAVYSACKAGVENFTRTMALELGEHGIRVNAIAPDHTPTPGTMGSRSGRVDPSTWRKRSAEEVDAVNRLIPLKRECLIEECGDATLFLASKLSSYVTGVTLAVDGGTMAGRGWLRDRAGRWTLNEGMVVTNSLSG